jgi:hypothetical protein
MLVTRKPRKGKKNKILWSKETLRDQLWWLKPRKVKREVKDEPGVVAGRLIVGLIVERIVEFIVEPSIISRQAAAPTAGSAGQDRTRDRGRGQEDAVIGVGVNQNPVKSKKKKKKKKKKTCRASAPCAVKNAPCTPALAPRSRSGAAGVVWPVMLM